MKPISGFDRPALQWLFVALALVLMAVAVVQAVVIRRTTARIESSQVAAMNAQLELQQLEMRFAREQSAREALSLEVGRLGGASATAGVVPTLTLMPPVSRGAQPPEPTVAPPGPSQTIALRLVLPKGVEGTQRYRVTIRSWSGGQALWSRGDLAASQVDGRPAIVAHLAGDVLARGAYEIVVHADAAEGPPLASYEITVG